MSQHRGIFHHLPGDRPRLGGARNSPTRLPRTIQKDSIMAKKPTEEVEETQPPTPPHVTRDTFTETHMEAHPVTGEQVPMAGPPPPQVITGPAPVAVGARKIQRSAFGPPLIGNRASHANFKRTYQLLRSMGMRRY